MTASRIIAVVPLAGSADLTEVRLKLLLDQMTPALNVIAGEIVFWVRTDAGWCATASARPTMDHAGRSAAYRQQHQTRRTDDR